MPFSFIVQRDKLEGTDEGEGGIGVCGIAVLDNFDAVLR